MRFPCALAAGSLLGLFSSHAAEFVLVTEDFENYDPASVGENSVNANNPLIFTTVPDPEPGGTRGTVGQVDLSPSGQFAALARGGGNIFLADIGAAPGDAYEYSFDAFIPDSDIFDPTDTLTSRARFTNSGGQDGKIEPTSTPLTLAALTAAEGFGQWFRISLVGTIPESDASSPQLAIREVEPILSIRDVNDDAPTGPALFVDNLEFKIITSDVDPNANISGANPFVLQKISDGRQLTSIDVTNAGLRRTLTLSIAITGPDADNFELDSDESLNVDPRSNDFIDLTFTPGEEVRQYDATLTITTNEEGEDNSIIIPLVVPIIPEDLGSEIFLNGGFEFSNIAGWIGRGRLSNVSSPVRTGNSAGQFVLTTPGTFKGFDLSQDVSPPNVEGDPRSIIITPEMRNQEFRFSGFVLSPEENGFPDTGTFVLEIRWNGLVLMERYFATFVTSGFFFDQADTWLEVSAFGTVPEDVFAAADSDERVPVESATILFYTNSTNREDTGNETIFFDDLSLEIDSLVVSDGPIGITDVSVAPNPNNPNSSLVTLSFNSETGAFYTIESSDDLVSFNEEAIDFPDGGADSESLIFQAVVPEGIERRYYRVSRQAGQIDP